MQEAVSAAKQMWEIELLLDQQPLPPSPDQVQAGVLAYKQLMQQHAAAALSGAAAGIARTSRTAGANDDSCGRMARCTPEELLEPSIPVDERLPPSTRRGAGSGMAVSTEACWRELQVGRPDTTGEIVPNTLGVLNVKLHTKKPSGDGSLHLRPQHR